MPLPVRGLYLVSARFVSYIDEGFISEVRGMYLLIRGFDLPFRTGISWFTRPISLFCPQKMTKKPGTKFRRSTGDFSKSFQFKNILTTKKWAVPAYIRGFDSFKPPMSRFCLWEAALVTRFWSRFGDLRGFDLSHIPPKGIYEANITPAAYLRGFDLVHCAIFGMIVPIFVYR